MSTSKRIDTICIAAIALTVILTILFVCGKRLGIEAITDAEDSGYFSHNDLLSDWDTSDATIITLADSESAVKGNGAYVKDGDIYIAYAGGYVVSGSLSNGKIVIDADSNDKIWLMLSDADVSCEDSAAIVVEQADKVFLTLAEGTENSLSSGKTYSDEAQKTGIDGVIYSRDDLTINGSGTLSVSGEYAHGIVCNDSLKITAGNISVSANEDAVHANDCVCIRDAMLNLQSGDDGITVSNDEQTDYLYIESGDIKIAGCYEGLEATTVTVAGGDIDITPTDDGINAEKLIEITGGSVRIVNENGRDADGLDSNKDIVISGGKLFISVSQSGGSCAIDYGSENQGECRIDGGTVIACGSNAMLEAISSNSKQAFIMKNLSGDADTVLTLESSDGTQMISETIPVGFSAVTISTPALKNNEVCTITIGNTTQEITVDSTSETGGGMGFGGMGGGMGRPGQREFDGTPPEMPEWNDPQGGGYDSQMPQMPDDLQSPPDGGNMPEWQNGTPPEMPDGENRGGMQKSDGNRFVPSEEGQVAPPADMPMQNENTAEMPTGNFDASDSVNQSGKSKREEMRSPEDTDFEMRDESANDNQTEDSAAQLKLIGISAAVLAAGLFIARVKKSRV